MKKKSGINVFQFGSARQELGGGGAQFLSVLQRMAQEMGCRNSKRPVIIFNSHHYRLIDVIRFSLQGHVVHLRVDGPMYFHGWKRLRDELKVTLASIISKKIIFQSLWSYRLMRLTTFNREFEIIHNCADPEVFSLTNTEPSSRYGIVFSSNSDNINKGYHWIHKIEEDLKSNVMAFGRFSGIDRRVSRGELARNLNNAKVYIAASRWECCSNALIEAIACGVVPVVLRSGSHPELVSNPYLDLVFETQEELNSIVRQVMSLSDERFIQINSHLRERFDAHKIIMQYCKFLNVVCDD